MDTHHEHEHGHDGVGLDREGAGAGAAVKGAGLDGRHDFDFLHGRWQVRNERLRERLVGSTDWEHFQALQECRPLLDGLGNIDGMRTDWGGGFEGMSLRLFDPGSRQWRIWWASNRDGQLDPAVTGTFRDGRGTFVGPAHEAGTPVLMRFTWDCSHATVAHWQQAFSTDEGASWETNWHMWLRRLDDDGRLLHHDAVLELRQYTMQPGRRDALVALFEREFIEPQEAVGMHVIGQFRDLDDPDRFVWLRGFPSMPARRDALDAFYSGPAWQRHRTAANATIVDSDDVLLLRPVSADSGLARAAQVRASDAEAASAAGALGLGICAMTPGQEQCFADRFARDWAPRLRQAGAQVLATWVTESSANTYPRLPVREGERVFAWLARFDDIDALDRGLAQLRQDADWREAIAAALLEELAAVPQWLRLAPTARSELR